MIFDYSYTHRSDYTDGMKVDVSTDCGSSFSEALWFKEGDDLISFVPVPIPWTPKRANHWARDTVYLNEFIDEKVVIRFTMLSQGANNLWLDNIFVTDLGRAPVAEFSISDNLVCIGDTITIEELSSFNPDEYQWEIDGAEVVRTGANGPESISYSSPGAKRIQLTVSNDFGADTFSVELYVQENPIANFNFDVQGNTANFTNTSLYATKFEWHVNGILISSQDLSYQFADGTHTVGLLASNFCGESYIEKDVRVINVEIPSEGFAVSLGPVPADSEMGIKIWDPQERDYTAEVYDYQGRLVSEFKISSQGFETESQILLGGWAPGAYILKLDNENTDRVFRFIKI